MEMLLEEQNSNFWAIEYLALLGNENPTQKQVDLMEMLIAKVSVEQKLSFDQRLSGKEKNCLLLAAAGKNTEETAKLLKLKQNTVKKYRLYIMRKLKCNNIAHAVFEGIRYGYLEPKSAV